MSEAHARLGPSNHRWPHCPGSVREEEDYPDSSSEAAIDGTGSHLLLELCLNEHVNAYHFESQLIGKDHEDMPLGWFVDIDRIKRVDLALDYIRNTVSRLEKEYPNSVVTVFAETKSNPGEKFGRTDWWGTCDATIMVHSGHILSYCEVIDYKDGRMYVDVNDNSQLIAYWWGKAGGRISLDTAVMTIIQPKVTKNPIRSQVMSVLDITQKAFNLKVAADRTDQTDAPLHAGKHCQWCKHKPNCTTFGTVDEKVVNKLEGGMLEKISTSLETMNSNDLAEIVDAEKAFIAGFVKAKLEVERRIKAGGFVPGYYMGKGNKKKVWNEEVDIVAKKLRGMKGVSKDNVFPSKLITPSQALKLEGLTEIQQNNISKLISEVDGKDTLKKGTVTASAEQMFGDTVPAISFL